MARAAIDTNVIYNLDRDAGTEITTLIGDTIVTGVDNGFIIPYRANSILVLDNATGLAATVTLVVNNPDAAEGVGLTLGDKGVAVADGEIVLYPMSAIFRQTDEEVYLDCDQAIDVAVINP